MKKIFLHAYTEQNLGDDMFIEYLCNRYPSSQFYIICKDCYKKALETIPNLTIFSSDEFLQHIDFNLQIFIGGSIFMQSNNKGIFEKYSLDQKKKLQGVPTYVIGANFGPYKSKIFLSLYKHFFKGVEQVVFRDKYSYELFQLRNTSWAPDILFNYPLPNTTRKKMIAISCIKKNQRSGLKEYNEASYFQKIAEIAEEYTKMNFEINLTCFSKTQGDDVAAQTIYNMLSPMAKSMTKILVYQGDINSFLKIFLSSAYIIGSRFHSVILGWSAGISFFPICYNSKFNNALCSYGFKGNYANIDKITGLDFSYFDFNRNTYSSLNRDFLKNKANNHFLFIDKILKEEKYNVFM